MKQYLYGIIAEPEERRFDTPGIGGAAVRTVNRGELAAVVSDAQVREIDPTRRNVRAHTGVQDELLGTYDLLPMGFGMVAEAPEQVEAFLDGHYDELSGEIARLAGKIEGAVKLSWEKEKLLQELEKESPRFRSIRGKLAKASSTAETEDLQVQAGELVQERVELWKDRYAERIYRTLADLALEARHNRIGSVESLLNASFLLEREREEAFREELYRMDARYEGRFTFKYIGPLPPYNFIQLKMAF